MAFSWRHKLKQKSWEKAEETANITTMYFRHNSLHSLTVSLRPLELGDFCESNVFGREKYAEFSELFLKIYEIKIQPLF